MSAFPASESAGREFLTRSRTAAGLLADALRLLVRNYDVLARRSAFFFVALLVGVIGTPLLFPELAREDRTTIFEPPKVTQYLFFLGLAEAQLVVAVTARCLAWPRERGILSARVAASFLSVAMAVFLKWLGVQIGITALLAQLSLLVRRPAMEASRWLILEGALLTVIAIGVVVFVRYFAVPATVVLEGKDVGKGAFTRSARLAVGMWPRVLGTLGVAWLALLALQVASRAIALRVAGDVLTAEVVAVLVSMLVYPYVGVVATLLYFSARARQEGAAGATAIAPPSRPPILR
ncbi:MAG TPA: hypothetical protein VJ803_02110 [Gemmatimonadaceae bacterium]|nr:hypothetical protein [Gemmatimonadaceae bacterium]